MVSCLLLPRAGGILYTFQYCIPTLDVDAIAEALQTRHTEDVQQLSVTPVLGWSWP